MAIQINDIKEYEIFEHLKKQVHPLAWRFRNDIDEKKALNLKKLNFRRWIYGKDKNYMEIRDLDFLEKFLNIETLFVEGKNIKSIEGIKHLTKATIIEVMSNWSGTVDISPIQNCRNLEKLSIDYSIDCIEGESSLNGRIQGWAALAELQRMKFLSLIAQEIENLEFLRGMNQLEDLELEESKVGDLSPLKGKLSLQRLNLRRCGIHDISALGTLQNLKVLDIGYNNIDDFSVLSSLSNLEVLVVDRKLSIEMLQELKGNAFLIEEVIGKPIELSSGQVIEVDEEIIEYFFRRKA